MSKCFPGSSRAAHAALLAVLWCASAFGAPDSRHPQGWSDLSYYLPMRDGVRLAVSVWFPEGKVPARRVPVILIQTRYGRAGVFGHGEGGRYRQFVDAGYAVAVVDTRGSTSSFGPRKVEIGPEEIADMDALIEHFRDRKWSTGQVIATGVSYMADTADIASASPAQLTATVVRESDFDAYLGLFYPGGVANDGMMNVWGGDTLPRDYGRSSNPADGLDCGLRVADCPKLWPRLQPVDADSSYHLLQEAIRSRSQHWQPDDYRDIVFRDDVAHNGHTVMSSSPVSYLSAMQRRGVPAQYWGSWMDAGTADAALTRFRLLPGIPMEVWITAHDHVNERLTDPFFPEDAAPHPSLDDQMAFMLTFMANARAHHPVSRVIHYYVLGAKAFKSTLAWPPVDAKPMKWRFGPERSLVPGSVRIADGQDHYAVDFTATSGDATRWSTQLGTPAAYGNRKSADEKLLSYTSAAFDQDMEVVGTPSLTLHVATSSADPAFFAYLEDVDAQGRSTYLTEGMIRAIHRRPQDASQQPHLQIPPAKSYLRKDAQPMIPREFAEVSFPVFSVAALIRAGHRLRVSLAGADASMFRRYSGGGEDQWLIDRSSAHPSGLTIAMRPWTDH